MKIKTLKWIFIVVNIPAVWLSMMLVFENVNDYVRYLNGEITGEYLFAPGSVFWFIVELIIPLFFIFSFFINNKSEKFKRRFYITFIFLDIILLIFFISAILYSMSFP